MAAAKKRGLFITFEGIEGLGKSTNLAFIQQWLIQQGIRVQATREPGGTPLAEKLRELLLLDWDEAISPQTELMLLFAGRAQHITTVIEPALARGDWILSDRFTDATYAYQGYGRGLPLAEIAVLEESVQHLLQPDLTILFDGSVATGLSRVSKRSSNRDRIEQEQADFFERVRQGYLQRAQDCSQRFHLVDAEMALESVQNQLKEALTPLLTAHCNES